MPAAKGSARTPHGPIENVEENPLKLDIPKYPDTLIEEVDKNNGPVTFDIPNYEDIKIEDDNKDEESPVKSEIVSQIAGLTFFNYKCHLCDLQLTSNADMRSHFQAKHEPVTVISENGALVHACKQCGARFSQYSSAIKHCRKRKTTNKMSSM